MSCKLMTSHCLNKPIWCLSAPLFTYKLLPLDFCRGSYSKQYYIKEFSPGDLFKSLEVLCAYYGSGIPKDLDTTGKIFWAWVQCRPPVESDGALRSLPSSPLQPLSIYRGWHSMTSPPPSTHTHTHTVIHKCVPMLMETTGWSNLWTPTQRFMSHWKQQGERERHVESDGEKRSAVYKYLGIHFSL